jgi:hypothetical protein
VPSRPVLFLIDVEPDDRKTSAAGSGWESSELAYDRLESLRSSLADATGRAVRFNWFLRCDPQIGETFGSADNVSVACPRIVRRAADGNDAAGIHVHLWKWSPALDTWYNELGDRQWIEHCIATSVDAFQRIFGEAPLMSRFGDRWLSQDALDVARELGIRYDLTVEPGLPGERIHDDPHATGSLPDFRDASRQPYRPKPDNYLVGRDDEHDPSDFWEIPLTTTRPEWRPVRRPPWLMRASRSPNLSLASRHVWPNLRAQLDRPSNSPIVIVFRSGDLAKQGFLRNFERTTELLVRHPALEWCEFTTPADAIERLTRLPT